MWKMNNIKIDKKGKKVEIVLNKNFYCLDVVKEGIADFKEVCNSSISDEEGIKISLKPKEKVNIDTLGYEFSNYVLGLMKNKIIS